MLRGRRVLLTGGTGFLGTRLAEILSVHEGALLSIFMRDAMKAAMVGRYPVQMHIAELSDTEALDKAAEGCEVVFHLAHDVNNVDSAAINLAAAKNVLAAADKANARLVYVSSAEVYGDGYFGSGTLDETKKKKPTANRRYASSKRAVEAVFEGQPNVVILEPTLIYGPYSKPWVETSFALLKSGWVLLPNDGEGKMNAVFVDDVVQACLKAATAEVARGEAFLISGPSPATWGQFYERIAQMLNRECVTYASSKRDFERARWSVVKQSTVDLFSALSDQEIIVRAERIPFVEQGFDAARQRLPQVWRSLKRTRDVPAGPPAKKSEPPATKPAPARTPPAGARVHLPDPHRAALYRSSVTVSHDRATRDLGYQPRFDFETSMAVIEAYARWAYLL